MKVPDYSYQGTVSGEAMWNLRQSFQENIVVPEFTMMLDIFVASFIGIGRWWANHSGKPQLPLEDRYNLTWAYLGYTDEIPDWGQETLDNLKYMILS